MPHNDKLDPIVQAALMEDEDETPEEKAMREELAKQVGVEEPSQEDTDQQESEETDETEDKSEETTEAEEEDEEQPEGDDTEEEEPDTPPEAEDDESEKTRKERRQERRENFLNSIRKEDVRNTSRPDIPNYQPLDYNDESKEFQPEELAQDREMVGAVNYARGVEEARYWANQEKFFDDLKTEAKMVAYDPKLKVLATHTPDGKPNPDFDEDITGEVNEMYLEFVGFKQSYKRDKDGRPIIDQNTGQPIVLSTVDKTDISYDKFARRYLNNMEKYAKKYASDEIDSKRDKLVKQRKNTSVRPNGGKRRSLGEIQLGDISRMSDEEFEKNEEEIDRQINSMLGL